MLQIMRTFKFEVAGNPIPSHLECQYFCSAAGFRKHAAFTSQLQRNSLSYVIQRRKNSADIGAPFIALFSGACIAQVMGTVVSVYDGDTITTIDWTESMPFR